ncbi:hypothetical protein BGZ83_000197 [Gryganskiella cystojenkinii]|nr:hypothetical protein BGZ83_000197 [Gryganskiella cystojenkinii]
MLQESHSPSHFIQPSEPSQLQQKQTLYYASNNTQQQQNHSPLVVTEVLQRIGDFLDIGTIVLALRVNQEWYETFLPRIWSKIDLRVSMPFHGPSFVNFEKHAALVQSLAIWSAHNFDFPESNDLLVRCPHLFALKIYDVSRHLLFKDESSLLSLIERHQPTVKTIHIVSFFSMALLETIVGCAQLERLELDGTMAIAPDQWEPLHDSIWSRLLAFEWKGSFLSSTAVSEDPAEFKDRLSRTKDTTLRDLSFMSEKYSPSLGQAQLSLILKCPDLVRLKWIFYDGVRRQDDETIAVPPPGTVNAIVKALNENSDLRFGERLEYLALPWTNLQDKPFGDLLQRFPSLTQLVLRGTDFNRAAWRVLQEETPQLIATLTTLSLRCCPQVTGDLIHEILCSMSSLKLFEADCILHSDFADQIPWVCRGLTHLYLTFVIQPSDQSSSSQSMILSRLSELKELVALDLDMTNIKYHPEQITIPRDEWSKYCLHLSLERGLDALKSLRQLERFRGPCSGATSWTEAEARWMLEHWPRLREMDSIELEEETKLLLRPRIRPSVFFPEF